MRLQFSTLSRAQAEEVVRWRYEPPYHVYNIAEDDHQATVEQFFSDQGSQFFAVLRDGELTAVWSFGKDGQVEGGEYNDIYLDMGGALRPDFTGQGLGEEVVRQGVEFGQEEFERERFRVTIADFNERAKTVYRRVGFKERGRFRRPSDGQLFVVFTIILRL